MKIRGIYVNLLTLSYIKQHQAKNKEEVVMWCYCREKYQINEQTNKQGKVMSTEIFLKIFP